MLDEAGGQAVTSGEEVVVDGSGAERRRAFRRKLPFGRGAVLVVGERAHIVGIADVSVTGAYLTTRAPSRPATRTSSSCSSCPPVELALPRRVVRVAPTRTRRSTTRAAWPSTSSTSTRARAGAAGFVDREPRRA